MTAFDLPTLSPFARLAWQLLPGTCVLCLQASTLPLDLCATCLDDLPWNAAACRRCGLRIDPSDASTAVDGTLEAVCGACLAHPPPFARTVAPLRYRGVVVDLVGSLKRGRSRVDARVLATLLAGAAERSCGAGPRPSLLVPVPMSLRRLLMRGQNQAAMLARHVGRSLRIEVDYDACRRVRHTAPQRGRSRRERLRNLAGAFECTRSLAGLRVAIVDDVMTTGATMRAVARTLLARDAAEVHLWVAARTDRIGMR